MCAVWVYGMNWCWFSECQRKIGFLLQRRTLFLLQMLHVRREKRTKWKKREKKKQDWFLFIVLAPIVSKWKEKNISCKILYVNIEMQKFAVASTNVGIKRTRCGFFFLVWGETCFAHRRHWTLPDGKYSMLAMNFRDGRRFFYFRDNEKRCRFPLGWERRVFKWFEVLFSRWKFSGTFQPWCSFFCFWLGDWVENLLEDQSLCFKKYGESFGFE